MSKSFSPSSQAYSNTELSEHSPYQGAIPFYARIVVRHVSNAFFHVGKLKISCERQLTMFYNSFHRYLKSAMLFVISARRREPSLIYSAAKGILQVG